MPHTTRGSKNRTGPAEQLFHEEPPHKGRTVILDGIYTHLAKLRTHLSAPALQHRTRENVWKAIRAEELSYSVARTARPTGASRSQLKRLNYRKIVDRENSRLRPPSTRIEISLHLPRSYASKLIFTLNKPGTLCGLTDRPCSACPRGGGNPDGHGPIDQLVKAQWIQRALSRPTAKPSWNKQSTRSESTSPIRTHWIWQRGRGSDSHLGRPNQSPRIKFGCYRALEGTFFAALATKSRLLYG